MRTEQRPSHPTLGNIPGRSEKEHRTDYEKEKRMRKERKNKEKQYIEKELGPSGVGDYNADIMEIIAYVTTNI